MPLVGTLGKIRAIWVGKVHICSAYYYIYVYIYIYMHIYPYVYIYGKTESDICVLGDKIDPKRHFLSSTLGFRLLSHTPLLKIRATDETYIHIYIFMYKHISLYIYIYHWLYISAYVQFGTKPYFFYNLLW